ILNQSTKLLFFNKFLSTSPPMDVHYRPNILPCKAFFIKIITGVVFLLNLTFLTHILSKFALIHRSN
ncbi:MULTISPECIES: hypothetical protein, partial [unclassified Acinetobacter]|uniref:hypothetical protein n=1 Tax=unclassified Acinetobacter TaxID=196816 RepID=UPI001C0959AB